MTSSEKEYQYLLTNGRPPFPQSKFRYFHKLYRTKKSGNPIEIPEKWGNAISCMWSHLILKKHITNFGRERNEDDYAFVFCKEIKRYRLKSEGGDDEYNGLHIIQCEIIHSPLEYNFSHCEILIKHQIFKNSLSKPIFSQVYTYEEWRDETALLKRKKSKFFKALRKEFRNDMIKLISRKSHSESFLSDIMLIFGVGKCQIIDRNFDLQQQQ